MNRFRSRWRATVRTGLVALGVVFVGAGCDLNDLLDADAPDRIPAEGLYRPGNAGLLVNGAVGDFECAFGAYVTLTGVMSGELTDATQTASRWPADRRNVQPSDDLYSTFGCTALGIYTPLSAARFSADTIASALQGWTDAEVPNRQELLATAAAYAGYSVLLLGEGFCSAAIDQSAELSSAMLFDSAVARFNTAIAAAQAAGNEDLEFFARVGRARANLNLGNDQLALDDAELIPEGFVWEMSASATTTRRENRVYDENNDDESVSVGPQYRNYQHQGVDDPRVTVVDGMDDSSDGTPLFFQQKYTSMGSPIPIASYDEAQLIIAEVDAARSLEIINAFHFDAGLPPFVGTPAQAQAHVVEERRAELWLEGHRFHDIRRFNLSLVPEPGTTHRKGGTYGDDRCFPLPDVEIRNNPNI